MTVLSREIKTAQGLSTAELAGRLDAGDRSNEAGMVDSGQVRTVAVGLKRLEQQRSLVPTAWDDPRFWNVDDDPGRRSQFFAIGNSINFRFWDLRDDQIEASRGAIDGVVYTGALYMWRALRRSLDTIGEKLLDASYLAALSEDVFDEIFSDDSGVNPLLIAREDRLANLRDLGEGLIDRWDGQFINVVQATGGSLVEFVRLSKDFRAFDDALFKLTMLNAIVHSGSGIYKFVDEPLPAVDYHLLKQSLRLGMVRPSPACARRLERQELLDADEASNLRRLAMTALVELADTVGISGEIVDNLLWANRTNCTDPSPICVNEATAALCPLLDACDRLTRFRRPLELTRYY